MSIVNIAAYLFVTIEDVAATAARLRAECARMDVCGQSLKGTILIAPEGINLFLAASLPVIDEFLAWLRTDARFAALSEKRQLSHAQPFARLKVKVKKEIVPLGVNNVSPARTPAPRMDAATLKSWLDQGKKFVLLDTRNRFEFDLGTFDAATDLGIGQFRQFPDAIKAKLAAWQDTPIVTFCTGGIRCEKAAPVMQAMGFKEVYQLDGGILKYFEQCGAAHYRGNCFVFDERVGLDGTLGAASA
jgi:UPF0176 protein